MFFWGKSLLHACFVSVNFKQHRDNVIHTGTYIVKYKFQIGRKKIWIVDTKRKKRINFEEKMHLFFGSKNIKCQKTKYSEEINLYFSLS